MTTYTQEQRNSIVAELSVAAGLLSVGQVRDWDDLSETLKCAANMLAAPSASQPLTLDQIHDALLSVCGDVSAPTSTDDPEFLELIVPLARAIEAKIKGGA